MLLRLVATSDISLKTCVVDGEHRVKHKDFDFSGHFRYFIEIWCVVGGEHSVNINIFSL